jgi:ABC-type bacteriocin/lantibiotic exporter with double-glycine peptidase domain
MKLNVPIIRQKKDSVDCGLACLSMLMKYYGIDRSISDMKNDIKVYEGLGTYAPQIGKYLIKNGFEIEIITMNPYLFTKRFQNKSKEDLIKYFDELHKKN